MAPEQVPTAEPPAPRVKTVACLAGISLERGVPADDIPDYIRDADNLVWVDVQDPGPAELAMLVDVFGLHPLALEDAAQGQRRPKVDESKGGLVLVAYAVVPGGAGAEPETAEVDLFLGRNYLVSLHRGRVPALEDALARWTRGGQLLREGVGFLVSTVLDAVIDSFAAPLDHVEEEIAKAETDVFAGADEDGVRNMLRLKRAVADLRRVLYPLREVFPVLLRRDHPLFPGQAQALLRDVYDHVLRLLDDLDTEREMVAGALEASLTVSANRLNKTMRTLAVITVAVAAVSSVFGAYGMNFEEIPLAKHPTGFWLISGGTVAAIVAAFLAGRWRRWW
jgi:magnesium transporter